MAGSFYPFLVPSVMGASLASFAARDPRLGNRIQANLSWFLEYSGILSKLSTPV